MPPSRILPDDSSGFPSMPSLPTLRAGGDTDGTSSPNELASTASNADPFRTQPTLRGRTTPHGERLRIGDVLLGRYTVLSELGQGGMGVVYKCLDNVGGIEVALKCLPPELSRNEAEMEGIRENYAIVARLHHSAISGLRNLEKDPVFDEYYLVMDLAEGEDLSALLRRRRGEPMPLPEVLAILRPLASALDYAHAEKVLHRDVKPANVKVAFPGGAGSPGEPKVQLLDFGLAAEVRSSMSRVSLRGHVGSSGTPAYMAPEQWEARPQSAATDQYALAVMAYQMLAGHLPFAADDADLLRRAVLSRAPDPVPGLPRAANASLLRALAKDPSSRFPSCTAFVEALGGLARSARPVRRIWPWVAALGLFAVGALVITEEYGKNGEGGASSPSEPAPEPPVLDPLSPEIAHLQAEAAHLVLSVRAWRDIDDDVFRKRFSELDIQKQRLEGFSKISELSAARASAMSISNSVEWLRVNGTAFQEAAKAKAEAERKAAEEAERKAAEQERLARVEAERKAREEAESKTEEEARHKVLQIEQHLAQGQFDEVRAVIAAEKDQDSPETWAMKSRMADYLFAYGRNDEAFGIYQGLYKKYGDKPPEALGSFYLNSLYKYAQMLLSTKRDKIAVGIYEAILRLKMEKPVKRQFQFEYAELLVNIAESEKDGSKERADYLAQGEKACKNVLWDQDLWFAKGVALLARIRVLKGDLEGAQKLVKVYLPTIKQIDDALMAQGRELGEDYSSMSPVAQCRYLVAVMLQNEAGRIMAEEDFSVNNIEKREEVLSLLLGSKIDGMRKDDGAYNHFLDVYIKYPDSVWAADAGTHAEQIRTMLNKTFGISLKTNVTPEREEEANRKRDEAARSESSPNPPRPFKIRVR